MSFCDKLNEYMSSLECSSLELAKLSTLSPATISRYRNGDRTPNIRSVQLKNLVSGLHQASIKKGQVINENEIYKAFASALNDILIDFEELSRNFNELISTFNISIADLSRFIGYDPSFISKIRTGNRKPSKPQEFTKAVSNFIATKYKSDTNKGAACRLINCTLNDIDTHFKYADKINKWLTTNSIPAHNYVNDFLNYLDTFNLNEYIKALHFDESEMPFASFYTSSSKSYYGLDEMRKSELDFFKATVFGESLDPIIICSDLPMSDMAKNVDCAKRWMYAITMMLKKGLHLNIIHNLNRPISELMLGLERWTPIYMTGQVTPYYLKGYKNNIYSHLLYVSGSAALNGECLLGNIENGMCYFTNLKTELSYYQNKANILLRKATPLLDIYKSDLKEEYDIFLEKSLKSNSKFRRILSSLPIHTISYELLLDILKKNNLSEKEINDILTFTKNHKKAISELLISGSLEDELHQFSEQDFKENPATLFLADSFFEKTIEYTYEDYLKHLEQTKEYSKNHKNYSLQYSKNIIFKNMQISICENNWVMVSKSNSPSIHFVVYHPKLRDVIQNFVPPIIE